MQPALCTSLCTPLTPNPISVPVGMLWRQHQRDAPVTMRRNHRWCGAGSPAGRPNCPPAPAKPVYNGPFSSKPFLEPPEVLSPSLKLWDHGAQGCPRSPPRCPSAPRRRALTRGAPQPLGAGLTPHAAPPDDPQRAPPCSPGTSRAPRPGPSALPGARPRCEPGAAPQRSFPGGGGGRAPERLRVPKAASGGDPRGVPGAWGGRGGREEGRGGGRGPAASSPGAARVDANPRAGGR